MPEVKSYVPKALLVLKLLPLKKKETSQLFMLLLAHYTPFQAIEWHQTSTHSFQ